MELEAVKGLPTTPSGACRLLACAAAAAAGGVAVVET